MQNLVKNSDLIYYYITTITSMSAYYFISSNIYRILFMYVLEGYLLSSRLFLFIFSGMRNQLYPNSFKFNINHIRDFEGGSSLGRKATGEEDEEQGVHINWDRIEPTEVKTDSLDFLVDEYLAQLMADYGVDEEIEEEEEELELELEDLGNISSDN